MYVFVEFNTWNLLVDQKSIGFLKTSWEHNPWSFPGLCRFRRFRGQSFLVASHQALSEPEKLFGVQQIWSISTGSIPLGCPFVPAVSFAQHFARHWWIQSWSTLSLSLSLTTVFRNSNIEKVTISSRSDTSSINGWNWEDGTFINIYNI